MRNIYTSEYQGLTFAKHEGEYLNLIDLVSLIKSLNETLALCTELGVSQGEIVRLYGYSELISPRTNTIQFPFTGKKRRGIYESGVYFATCPAKPGAIKIGSSADLFQRMKQLRHELKSPVTPIAFMPLATDLTEIETAFHKYFSPDCVGGEWFTESVIVAWLEAIQ